MNVLKIVPFFTVTVCLVIFLVMPKEMWHGHLPIVLLIVIVASMWAGIFANSDQTYTHSDDAEHSSDHVG